MPGSLFWKYKPLFLYGLLRMLGGAIRDHHIGSFIKGVAKSFVLLPNTRQQRKKIQGNLTVSTEYIDGILYKSKPLKIPKIN